MAKLIQPEILTQREREVLTLVAKGYTSKKIAIMLNLSPKTVSAHRSSIRQKLKVGNTAGMIRYAIQFELVK